MAIRRWIDKSLATGLLGPDGDLYFTARGTREEIASQILAAAEFWGKAMTRAEAEATADLTNGRTFYQGLLGLFEVGGKALSLSKSADALALRLAFEKVTHSLKNHEWSVVWFALGSVVSFRNRRNTNNGRK